MHHRLRPGFVLLVATLGVALVALAIPADRAASAPPVPPEYADMYGSLSSELDSWQTSISALPPVSGPEPVFGGHVLAANGNRGTGLLNPATMPVVDQSLDRLKELGIGGVTLSVDFPLLNADYPHSSEYLAFYETVAQHVRARGLALSVEQHIAFHDTPFSTISFDFSQLPFAQFESQFHTMAQLVIDHLHPDYLTLLSEPDTFGRLTGYTQAQTPAGAVAMIETVVAGLQRGATSIGAGSGSWLANAPSYAQAFAASAAVDYISLHIYPVASSALDIAQTIVNTARAAGKPVVLDEAWLYKVGPDDPPPVTFDDNATIFKRDNYSFWAPLDAQFLTLLKQFVTANHIAYVAPFWTTFFWAYIDYGPSTKDLTYQQVTQLVNQSVLQALQNDTFTTTADAWRVSMPFVDGDGDGVADSADNCPVLANPGQQNADNEIGNGSGILTPDTTVPGAVADTRGDACEIDGDTDNDGLPDADELSPTACAPFDLSTTTHPAPAGGDITSDDGNGPSWDTDNDGVLDGVECQLGTDPRSITSKPNATACGGSDDEDLDGLPASAEHCKWGTSDANVDSDSDTKKDCVEANDTNGDGVQNFPGDTVNSAKAAAGVMGKTMDFDLNGDGAVNFPGDTILSAKMVNHMGGICA